MKHESLHLHFKKKTKCESIFFPFRIKYLLRSILLLSTTLCSICHTDLCSACSPDLFLCISTHSKCWRTQNTPHFKKIPLTGQCSSFTIRNVRIARCLQNEKCVSVTVIRPRPNLQASTATSSGRGGRGGRGATYIGLAALLHLDGLSAFVIFMPVCLPLTGCVSFMKRALIQLQLPLCRIYFCRQRLDSIIYACSDPASTESLIYSHSSITLTS